MNSMTSPLLAWAKSTACWTFATISALSGNSNGLDAGRVPMQEDAPSRARLGAGSARPLHEKIRGFSVRPQPCCAKLLRFVYIFRFNISSSATLPNSLIVGQCFIRPDFGVKLDGQANLPHQTGKDTAEASRAKNDVVRGGLGPYERRKISPPMIFRRVLEPAWPPCGPCPRWSGNRSGRDQRARDHGAADSEGFGLPVGQTHAWLTRP